MVLLAGVDGALGCGVGRVGGVDLLTPCCFSSVALGCILLVVWMN